MPKFNKGDKVVLQSVDCDDKFNGYQVGDELTITESYDDTPQCVNKKGETRWFNEGQLIHKTKTKNKYMFKFLKDIKELQQELSMTRSELVEYETYYGIEKRKSFRTNVNIKFEELESDIKLILKHLKMEIIDIPGSSTPTERKLVTIKEAKKLNDLKESMSAFGAGGYSWGSLSEDEF